MINEASATASPAVLYTFPCGPEFPAPACLLALGPLALPASSSWCWTGGTGAGGLEWGIGREKGAGLGRGGSRTDAHPWGRLEGEEQPGPSLALPPSPAGT